ncbi:lipopolysaccharide biosynthesis protein [Nocardioides coralli]|uniref:lipopolysaccharide biosynthesis protein n=1 Tax=Nocardioides coralli TaxID=2872154 RepID=UPI001CA43194|nr:lipopolysaccharide biosynthesis protein [Nocardioides coralli]QZY29798.1 lipopolysaccharide biosynthesis protein [Nocardioides coralli]
MLGALVWFGTSYGVAVVGYLVGNAVASRWLGLSDYGYFVVALTSSTVVGQLGLLGAHRGGLRDAARLEADDLAGLAVLRRGARAAALISLPAAALVAGLVLYLASGPDREALVLAVGFALLAVLGGLQKLWASYLRGFGRVRFASLLEGRSGGALVSCLQAASLALAWWLFPETGLAGAVLALAAGYAVPVLAAGFLVSRRWSGVPGSGSVVGDVREMVGRNWRFAVNQVAVYLAGTVEIWIAAAVLVSADASFYSAAQRMALVLAIAPTSLQVVFAPVISRMLASGDRARLEAVLRTGASVSAVATLVLLVPMLVVPGDLLALVFGEPFREAALLLFLLSAAQIGNVVSGQCGTALTMSHQEGVVATVQSVSVALRVGLGTAAALLVGVVGLAVVSSAISIAVYLTLWWLARQRLGLRTHPTLRPRLGLLRRTAG